MFCRIIFDFLVVNKILTSFNNNAIEAKYIDTFGPRHFFSEMNKNLSDGEKDSENIIDKLVASIETFEQ
jgi:hypothetical protein